MCLYLCLQPNVSDKEGMTPLLTACYEGHNDAVELLLEYDADIVRLWPAPPHSLPRRLEPRLMPCSSLSISAEICATFHLF